MNILLVTEYFPPEIGAGSVRAFENSKRWVENGINVTVITGFPDYPDGIIPKKYRGYKFYREEIEGIKVIRTFTIPAPNKGFFKRVLSFISFLFSSVIQGTWASGHQNILIATSPPFFVGIAGYFISRLKGIPFVFEVRDLWPESIIQLGQLKSKLVITILEFIEKFLYSSAIHIVAVADSTVKILVEKGISAKKISVVKNGIDPNLMMYKKFKNDLKNELGLHNIIVTYIGTIGLSHSVETIVKTAKLLELNDKISFLVVGDGAEKVNVERMAQMNKLNNVFFVGKVSREEIANYYFISDIMLVTLKNLSLFKCVIPSKIFEIMAFGKPIIIGVDGEARKIVEKAKSGIFTKPEDPIELKQNILLLANDEKLRHELGCNGKEYVTKYYNRKKLADDYIMIIDDLVAKNNQ